MRRLVKIAAGAESVSLTPWNSAGGKKTRKAKKHQVCVDVFGKNITWTKKYGHNSSWDPFDPTDATGTS